MNGPFSENDLHMDKQAPPMPIAVIAGYDGEGM
jgi:hypothetical protein